MLSLRSFLPVTIALTALAGSANAATFLVTTTADSGAGSLRQAITNANLTAASDRIQFSIPTAQQVNGVWTINLESELPYITTPMLINGPGWKLLTVRRNATAQFGIFVVADPQGTSGDGTTPLHQISGMILDNANSTNGAILSNHRRIQLDSVHIRNSVGGGILEAASVLTANNCVFENNTASTAGALAITFDSQVTLNSCKFLTNTATTTADKGGGAITVVGKLTATNCTFQGNKAASGGAVDLAAGYQTPTVGKFIGCRFVSNTADNAGGAVRARLCTVDFQQCNFSGNKSGAGGVLYSYFSTATLSNSLLTSNSGTGSAAVRNESGTLTLTNCTLSANLSTTGGSIHSTVNGGSTTTTLVNCTVSRNSKVGASAEILATAGTVNLLNTLLRPSTGAAALSATGGTIVSLGHNLSEDSGGGFLTGPSDITNTPSGLSTAGLKDNGGPTKTIALLSTSAAVDAGDDSVLSAPYSLTSDQRVIYPRLSGSHVDIGAYEYQQPASLKAAGSSANSS